MLLRLQLATCMQHKRNSKQTDRILQLINFLWLKKKIVRKHVYGIWMDGWCLVLNVSKFVLLFFISSNQLPLLWVYFILGFRLFQMHFTKYKIQYKTKKKKKYISKSTQFTMFSNVSVICKCEFRYYVCVSICMNTLFLLVKRTTSFNKCIIVLVGHCFYSYVGKLLSGLNGEDEKTTTDVGKKFSSC